MDRQEHQKVRKHNSDKVPLLSIPLNIPIAVLETRRVDLVDGRLVVGKAGRIKPRLSTCESSSRAGTAMALDLTDFHHFASVLLSIVLYGTAELAQGESRCSANKFEKQTRTPYPTRCDSGGGVPQSSEIESAVA